MQRLESVTDQLNDAMQMLLRDQELLAQYTLGRRCNATDGKLGARRRAAPAAIRLDVEFLKGHVRMLSVEYDEALRDVFRMGAKVDKKSLDAVRVTRSLLGVLLKK